MNVRVRSQPPAAWLLAAVMLALSPHPALARIWTDHQGRTVDADLLRVEGSIVVLREVATEREHRWPLANLGDADQAFATSTYRLVTSLRSRARDTRDQAAEKLADIGGDAVAALIEELKRKNGCEGSIQTLARIGVPAVPYLLRRSSTMSSKEVERSRRETGIPNPAATALLRVPAPTIRASLEHESEELRVLFLSHVGAAPDAALHGEAIDEIAVGLLPGLLDSENPSTSEAAKRALAKALHGNSKDVSAAAFRILHQRVEGADLPTRLKSVMELGRLEGSIDWVFATPPAAEEFVRSTVMEAITESQDADARRSAAELVPHLTIFRGAAPVSDLIKLLNVDDLPKVRGVAVLRLGECGADAKPAIPALIQLLKVPEHRLLTGVLLALEKIGLSEPGVLDALVTLAAESDEGTCAVLRNLIMRQRSVLFNKRESVDVLGRLYQAVIANNRLSADFRGNWGSEILHIRANILNSKR